MENNRIEPTSWRERKRHETLQRIADSGLRLFTANGYEATTLDMIAEAAGISRRTFFYYFSSKEEILLAWQTGLPATLHDAVLDEPTDQPPLNALRNAILKLEASYKAEPHNSERILIYRIMRSSEHLRATSQIKHLHLEEAAFEALCKLWPQAEQRRALRAMAMIAVGILRLSLENWAEEGGQKALTDYLLEGFAILDDKLG